MTSQQILTALNALNIEGCDRAIQAELTEMLGQGVVDNDQERHPRGYALVVREG
jgi:hypothetical protein